MATPYALSDHEKERVANYFEPGMSARILHRHDDFGSWTMLLERPDRALMRHYNGAMMWVALEGGRAMSYEIVEGDDARDLDDRYGA